MLKSTQQQAIRYKEVLKRDNVSLLASSSFFLNIRTCCCCRYQTPVSSVSNPDSEPVAPPGAPSLQFWIGLLKRLALWTKQPQDSCLSLMETATVEVLRPV